MSQCDAEALRCHAAEGFFTEATFPPEHFRLDSVVLNRFHMIFFRPFIDRNQPEMEHHVIYLFFIFKLKISAHATKLYFAGADIKGNNCNNM